MRTARHLLALILAITSFWAQADQRQGPEDPLDAQDRVGEVVEDQSVARQWNEELLSAIRNDFARPTVHARNLFHASAAMWDAWAAFDSKSHAVFHEEFMPAGDIEEARNTAISHALHRLLRHRFATSPGNDPEDPSHPDNTLNRIRQRMIDLGHDPDFSDSTQATPESLGIRIANTIIQFGLDDGANESNGYASIHYQPVNPALQLDSPGNPDIVYPNRWQPLQREDGFVDQSGNQVGNAQVFLGPEWGRVASFSLQPENLAIHPVAGGDWEFHVWLDPGPPPFLGAEGDAAFKSSMLEVIEFSSLLDPDNGELINISPASLGNNSLGSNDGNGHALNPHTGAPYPEQWVAAGDFFRVIAEYWADGPASETPPGHWFTILNGVTDDPQLERRIGGQGPQLDPLEWDVKAYLAMGGAMHDAAIAAWSVKGFHDSIRPVAAIRYMAEMGQSSDPQDDSYHVHGLPLQEGLVELITSQTISTYHAHLADHVGEVAVLSWRGHVHDPETETAGVGWILAKEWWPYQQPDFVTPPFAGYVSGHSTFSRAAAHLLTLLTGDEFFPGGLGEYCVQANDYLTFELGPSEDLCLQWARYYDAADQSSISRIHGGIHPDFDDFPGRFMGHAVGLRAWVRAQRHFLGDIHPIFRDNFR